MADNSMKNEPWILGIDLGTASIGWSKIPFDLAELNEYTVDGGVELFDSSMEPGGIKEGAYLNKNVKRRLSRNGRVNDKHAKRRRRKLYVLLPSLGMLPSWPCSTAVEMHNFIEKLEKQLIDEYKLNGKKAVYHLRTLALDQQISLYALGQIFMFFCTCRGWAAGEIEEEKEETQGVIKEGIRLLGGLITGQPGGRTVGEVLYNKGGKIRHRQDKKKKQEKASTKKEKFNWFLSRQMCRDEFDLIWANQAKYYPDILTNDNKNQVAQLLFHQRPIEDKSKEVGMCSLEENERRCPKSDLIYQRFRYWQKLLNMTVLENEEFRPLTAEEQNKLAAILDTTPSLSFSDMRTALGFKRKRGTEEYKCNLESEKNIKGNTSVGKIHPILSEYGVEGTDELYNTIITVLTGRVGNRKKANKLVHAGIPREAANELVNIQFEPCYGDLSKKAMEKLLTVMVEKRINYASAVKDLYPDRNKVAVCSELPPVVDFFPNINNPVVIHSLSMLRKVVNGLIRKYGKPALCRVELAREVGFGHKKLVEIQKKQQKDRAENENAAQLIKEHLGIDYPSKKLRTKVRLMLECGGICPYTGREITWENLNEFDIEHIIPRSRCWDSGFVNLTLCSSYFNTHVKMGLTPRECFANDKAGYKEVLTRVRKFKGDFRDLKYQRFMAKNLDSVDTITSSVLNDTRTACKWATKYLSCLYGGVVDEKGKMRVQTNKGKITAVLRRVWGLNHVLRDDGEDNKNREDHRHHAVDALAVALCSPKIVMAVTKREWEIENKRISYAERSAYRPEMLDLEVEDIRGIAEALVSLIIPGFIHKNKPGGELHGANAEKYVGILLKNGKESPSAEYIGKRQGNKRWVMVRGKHHVEVFSKETSGGVVFTSCLVSQKEAARRQSKKEHVVCKTHKPGWSFVCSLCKGDYVCITDADGLRHFYRVARFEEDGRMTLNLAHKRVDGGENVVIRQRVNTVFAEKHPKKVRVFLNDVRVVHD